MSRSLLARIAKLEQQRQPRTQSRRPFDKIVFVEEGATPAETEQQIAKACAKEAVTPERALVIVGVRPVPRKSVS